jgi:Homoserine dehydrogenase, NAD binding domain
MRVGLAGFGTAGQEVARRLVAGAIEGMTLSAVTARDLDKARANAARLDPAPAVVPLAELPAHAEVIAECATAEALPEIVRVCLSAGRTVLVVSAAGLLDMPRPSSSHGRPAAGCGSPTARYRGWTRCAARARARSAASGSPRGCGPIPWRGRTTC